MAAGSLRIRTFEGSRPRLRRTRQVCVLNRLLQVQVDSFTVWKGPVRQDLILRMSREQVGDGFLVRPGPLPQADPDAEHTSGERVE